MPKINAAIFDFDGTILDSEPFHLEAWKNTLPQFTKKKFNLKIHESLCGIPEKIVSEKLKIHYEIRESASTILKVKEKKFLELALQKSLLREGVLFRIEEAQKLNLKLAIATSGTPSYLDPLLKKFNLFSFFPVIVTAEDITNGKPHPEIYQKTAKLLKENCENCLVFEDSPNGTQSGLSAGCFTIVIPNTITQNLKFPKSNFTFKSFLDFQISDILKTLESPNQKT
jgi:HAD superfamily hydrolase (TIGR01509 family)